jgi:antitoxin component YwqK of YwqJK toxin-antitoxin module
MTGRPLRVGLQDIDFNPATYIYSYDGRPFTGEIVEPDADAAMPKATTEFRDGIRHGVSRVFYPDGKVRTEARYVRNLHSGPDRTWYHSGQLEEEIMYSDEGRYVHTKRWSENGTLTYSDYAKT